MALQDKMSKRPVSNLPADEEAVNALLGEVGPYGKQGMQWVASAIRNRNQGLQGVYGHKNPNVLAKKYTPQQLKEAQEAWEEAKSYQFTDAHHWFSDADMKQANVQNIIKKDKLEFIAKVGHNNFFRKPKGKK